MQLVCVVVLLAVLLVQSESADDSSCPSNDLHNLSQHDPELMQVIKAEVLMPPPAVKSRPDLNMTEHQRAFKFRAQYGQPFAIQDLFYGSDAPLKDKEVVNRFFVEAGAYDGAFLSNSLFLEMKHKWTGLLVEPNPEAFKILQKRGRDAWLFPGCLSTKNKPELVQFDAAGLVGGIENTDDPSKPKPGDGSITGGVHRRTIQTQCHPFYSILKSLGNPRIDYLSLDIEGSELQVLQTLPWDDVDISVLGIEINHLGEVFPGHLNDLRQLLVENGYTIYQKVSIDEIYVKKSLLKKFREINNGHLACSTPI